MNDIDERIRAALAEEDSILLKDLEHEPGLFEMVSISFKGKQAWITFYTWITGFVAFGLGVYAYTRFLAEPDIKTSLAWALGIIACMLVLAITKVLAWQQLHRVVVMRELKRLELRVLSVVDQGKA